MHGAVKRVRPKLMTVVAAFMGLLPIMWSAGAGADVMKRIAAPMVGGLATSFALELLVYPVLYATVAVAEPRLRRRQRARCSMTSSSSSRWTGFVRCRSNPAGQARLHVFPRAEAADGDAADVAPLPERRHEVDTACRRAARCRSPARRTARARAPGPRPPNARPRRRDRAARAPSPSPRPRRRRRRRRGCGAGRTGIARHGRARPAPRCGGPDRRQDHRERRAAGPAPSLVADTLPPCASTIPRQIASPSPRPPRRRPGGIDLIERLEDRLEAVRGNAPSGVAHRERDAIVHVLRAHA